MANFSLLTPEAEQIFKEEQKAINDLISKANEVQPSPAAIADGSDINKTFFIKTTLTNSEIDSIPLPSPFSSLEGTEIGREMKGRTCYFVVNTGNQDLYFFKLLVQSINTSISDARTSLLTPSGPIHIFSHVQPSFLNLDGFILSQYKVSRNRTPKSDFRDVQKNYYKYLLTSEASKQGYKMWLKTPEGFYRAVITESSFNQSFRGVITFSMIVGIISNKGKYLPVDRD